MRLDLPIFVYWEDSDRSLLSPMLAEWRAHFPELQILNDPDVVAMLEEFFPEKIDLYLSIRIPAAKSDVARLLALHKLGGLYVDCHYGLADPEGVRRLIERLNTFDAIFVNRTPGGDPAWPDLEYFVNGVMVGRPHSELYLEMADLALQNLERQRWLERENGFVGYNIFSLTGSRIIDQVILSPGDSHRKVREELSNRVLILQEQDLPVHRDRWRTYTIPGRQWHVRQQTELLFAQ